MLYPAELLPRASPEAKEGGTKYERPLKLKFENRISDWVKSRKVQWAIQLLDGLHNDRVVVEHRRLNIAVS